MLNCCVNRVAKCDTHKSGIVHALFVWARFTFVPISNGFLKIYIDRWRHQRTKKNSISTNKLLQCSTHEIVQCAYFVCCNQISVRFGKIWYENINHSNFMVNQFGVISKGRISAIITFSMAIPPKSHEIFTLKYYSAYFCQPVDRNHYAQSILAKFRISILRIRHEIMALSQWLTGISMSCTLLSTAYTCLTERSNGEKLSRY